MIACLSKRLNMTKTAILFSGSAYNIRFSLQSLLDNLIIPNDADVFVLTTRYCLRRKTVASTPIPDVDKDTEAWAAKNKDTIRDMEPLNDEELQLIRGTFGDRLKVLQVADDMPDYMEYLQSERNYMWTVIKEYNRELLSAGKEPTKPGSINSIVDQYRHAWKLYQLMQEYEKQSGVKYDWVARFRIDFTCPFTFNLKHYYENHDEPYLYLLHGFSPTTAFWCEEYGWFSKRMIADKLFGSLNQIGFITDAKYNTVEGNHDHRFTAEVQFGQLLHKLGLQDKIIPIRIWRSSMYTNGGDGFDYFNYEFRRAKIDLDFEYDLVCKCKTDINEHLPTLRRYAEMCDHVTEFGIRWGNSTVAFMAARPKKFVSYDVTFEEKHDYLKLIASDNGVNWEYKLVNPSPEDATESNLEPTDLLFIDTNHHARQASLELRLHADRVRRFIIFHDVETFGYGLTGGQGGEAGLWYAINPFLEANPNWKIREKFKNNNGLLVIERIS